MKRCMLGMPYVQGLLLSYNLGMGLAGIGLISQTHRLFLRVLSWAILLVYQKYLSPEALGLANICQPHGRDIRNIWIGIPMAASATSEFGRG